MTRQSCIWVGSCSLPQPWSRLFRLCRHWIHRLGCRGVAFCLDGSIVLSPATALLQDTATCWEAPEIFQRHILSWSPAGWLQTPRMDWWGRWAFPLYKHSFWVKSWALIRTFVLAPLSLLLSKSFSAPACLPGVPGSSRLQAGIEQGPKAWGASF